VLRSARLFVATVSVFFILSIEIGCLKRAALSIHDLSVHFFCSSKRNEPKKRRPEMPTSAKTGACYASLNGATVLAEVRTISGLANALPSIALSDNCLFCFFCRFLWS